MNKTKLSSIVLSLTFLAFASVASAASPWPANTSPTSNIGSGLTAYNNSTTFPAPATDNGFEASGAAYLSNYGYIVNGDDGDVAGLSSTGSVLNYWYVGGDLEDVAITDTTVTDRKILIANESGTKVEEFSLATGTKTGLSWNLSGLTVSGSDGLEALAYVPAAYAPASWGTALSGGFVLAASQAEARVYVYNLNRSSSGTVSPVTSFAVSYSNVSALHYNPTTQLLYVTFDSADKLKEYDLNGNIISSYTLPAAGSTEGVAVVPNCTTNKAQIVLTNDAVTSAVYVYDNYPITCPTAPVTTVDADSDGVVSTLDCNDNDATISSNRTYYRDADGDGLGSSSSTTSVCSLTAPSGYVTTATDLNDSDYDNDGVGTSSDCNDASSSISAYQTYYRDADGDGLGTSATTSVVCSYTVTSGYVTNSSDLNDSDYDNDTVATTADCNDADATVSSYLTVYQDYDGDGLGNAAVSQQVCALTAPTGYVTNNTDTDDSGVVVVPPTPDPDPTYSPIEYISNGIDDDGDGVVDEWNTLASNGVHPTYGSYNANDKTLYTQVVTSIASGSNGTVKVKFADGSGYRYYVLSKGTTTVSSYNGTAYLVVRSGRRYALVNAYTGQVLDSLRSVAGKSVKVHLKTLSLHRQ